MGTILPDRGAKQRLRLQMQPWVEKKLYAVAMPTLSTVIAELEKIAPLRLAAAWDAVGLLVGSRRPDVTRVMTCLTLTPEVAHEAVAAGIDLIVSHHPFPFRPVARLTDDSVAGGMLLDLTAAGIAVWSSHTAWDSAVGGINDQLAKLCGLTDIAPIEPDGIDPRAGFGRLGTCPDSSVGALAKHLERSLGGRPVTVAGRMERAAGRVGIVCGSGGDAVAGVRGAECTTLLTGEIKLHQALEAMAAGLAVIAVGHHASEHFSLAQLSAQLTAALPGLVCWPSRRDCDPFVGV